MIANRYVVPVVSAAVLLLAVPVADAAGLWVSSGKSAILAQDHLTVDDVKGRMTVQQVADGLGLPVADVVAAIHPPAGVTLEPTTALKDLEVLVPGFSVPALREVLRPLVPAH